MPKPTHAAANPTKSFFVRMITRDIMLEDCILDLIDNSIDGAWKLEGAKPMTLGDDVELSKYQIDIEVDADHFKIADNCGGITLDEAARYAFTFGREDSERHEKYSIGVYGIGMKRAVFKIGESITVRSTYTDETGREESFLVPINVPAWLNDKSGVWDFDIDSAEPLNSPGVEIRVTDLTESTSNSFRDPAFLQTLRKIIGRDYALHLHRGLRITLNEEPIRGWNIELREGGGFVPMRRQYMDESNSVPILVEILAGMAAPPPESVEPDERRDRDSDPRFGWYIVCNGRIVLSADTSQLSGWGVGGCPKWHPQYAGFIGLVIFSSEDAASLPLTTTKRSVDAASDVYRRALPKMRDAAERWIGYTNERKQSLDEAKRHESDATPRSMFVVAPNEAVEVPELQKRPKVKMANVAYSVPRERLRKLAAGFGDINLSYREVGMQSFEYAYADQVGDE